MLTAEQKAWRRKWSEALRSGRYGQGTGMLKDKHGGFCCLGVACDLVDPTKWAEDKYGAVVWDGYWDGVWPVQVRDMFGVHSEDENTLMYANDRGYLFDGETVQFSFEEIADVIDYMTLGGV